MTRYLYAAADLLLTYCVKLPLLVLVALPAYVIGYAWVIAYGSFLAGIDTHEGGEG